MERTYLVPSDKGQPGRARRLALAASHPAVAAATCGIASMLDTHAAVKRLQADLTRPIFCTNRSESLHRSLGL